MNEGLKKVKSMEKINESAFMKLYALIGNETYQIVREGDAWYEQLSVDETTYRHRLLTIVSASYASMAKKDQEKSQKASSKSQSKYFGMGQLKESQQGPTCAYVWEDNSFLYYCLVPQTRSEKARAMQHVVTLAQSLANRKSKVQACAAQKRAA